MGNSSLTPKPLLRGRSGGPPVKISDGRKVRDRLSELLTNKSWSKKKLAEELQVAPSTVTGWFGNPPRLPSGTSLYLLSRSTMVSLNWLLFDDGPEIRGSPAKAIDLGKALCAHVRAALVAARPELTAPSDKEVPPRHLFRYLPSGVELLEWVVRRAEKKAYRRFSKRRDAIIKSQLDQVMGLKRQPRK